MTTTLAARFWPKVDRRGPDECWPWTGALCRGYGVVWAGETRRAAKAHRVAYELAVGPIPDDLPLDHLCRNTRCVNPRHLEPVTAAENNRRAAPFGVKAQQTHCRHGHEFTAENTRRTHRGTRDCRTCHAARMRRTRRAAA